MSTLFMILALVSLGCLILGMVKPASVIWWGGRTKKQVAKTYATVFFVFFIFSGLFIPDNPSASIQAHWYEGGTLHQKRITDWKSATYANKLATCADFVAGTTGKIDKEKAAQLVMCIDKAAEAPSTANEDVATLGATCMVLMRHK